MNTEIQQTIDALEQGNTILYPTDTVWGIGCDATNPEAVKKVYALKRRDDTKAMICLVSDIIMLKKYVVELPEAAYDVIAFADKPTTIIYDCPVGVAENLIAPDSSLAIRIVYEEFCQDLIRTFGKPIVSTSANISGEPTPTSFKEISKDILEGADYVVSLHHGKKCNHPSSIVKVDKDGVVTIIRE